MGLGLENANCTYAGGSIHKHLHLVGLFLYESALQFARKNGHAHMYIDVELYNGRISQGHSY